LLLRENAAIDGGAERMPVGKDREAAVQVAAREFRIGLALDQ